MGFIRGGKSNSVSNESFWKSLQQTSQIACKREDTADGVRHPAEVLSLLLEDRPGPKDRSSQEGRRLQLHLRKTFLTELLNN